MKTFLSALLLVTISITGIVCIGTSLSAQESQLPDRQSGVAQRYERLEELLLRLAEMEAAENPERAALLKQAARQSRDQFVLDKLRTASNALRAERFQEAVDNQASATEGLEGLLQLLMSEDRSKRIRDEKERVANLIKDLKRIERAERSTRARTENGADMKDVQKEQESITERSEKLKQELSEDAFENKDPSDQPELADPTDQTEKKDPTDSPKLADPADPTDKTEKKDPADSPKPADPSDQAEKKDPTDSSKPADSADQTEKKDPTDSSSPSESGDPTDQTEKSDPPESSKSSDQPPNSDSTPQTPQQLAEQQLQKAIEKMQQAEQELETSERESAVEKQREAEENLRQAIDQLERILRQLREEEMLRELAKIEARLRKMAAMQSKVLDDTITLAATPKSQRNRQTDLKAGNLAFEEKKITLEADRAMLLLREEGSSVAFPEVVSQIRLDTTRVAERLGQTKIDAVTQGIQQDILSALEEMIEALQKAQRDLEQKKQQEQQQQGKPQQGGEQEPPLVEELAELKLLRTMEERVKSTTTRYSELIKSGDSSTEEVLPLLQDLSERQNRLYQITRDLVLKRNQ